MKTRNLYFYLFLFFSLLSFWSCEEDSTEPTVEPGTSNYFIEVTGEKTIDKATILSEIKNNLTKTSIFDVNDVKIIAIKYNTTDVDGKSTVASGVIAMPVNTKDYDLIMSIQHVTLDLSLAPTKTMFSYEMAPAAFGKVVVMADNLGYGVNENESHLTPYLHLKYTGGPCADMIEAAREYFQTVGITEKGDKIELAGYSQGGTSTLATLLTLEERGLTSRITTVNAGGTLFDMMSTFQYFISLNSNPYDNTGFVPLIVNGMSYGEGLTLKDENIYAPEALEILPSLQTMEFSKWHKALGTDLTKILNKDFYAAPTYNNNQDVLKLLAAMKKNSLAEQPEPQTHVTFYHSQNDEYIPYKTNATVAVEKWPNSTMVDLNANSHVTGALEFYLRILGFL